MNIEAVETFLGRKTNELGLGFGLFPFNPYFDGFAVNSSYVYHFNKTFAWEVLSASYIFGVQKGLTVELADKYKVNPKQIVRPSYVVSTNLMIAHTNGKLVFAEEFVRYFRASVLLGVAMVNNTQKSNAAASFGARFELFSSEAFSWKIDIRDAMTLSGGVENLVSFTFGTGFNF